MHASAFLASPIGIADTAAFGLRLSLLLRPARS
jgi:hypothetical protein